MHVYNDTGNMVNDRATILSTTIAQQVGRLFDTLLTDGMTAVEGRALLGYFKSEITAVAIGSILDYQMVHVKNAVSVNVDKIASGGLPASNYPACLEKCPHSRECANHTTAGDYRTEDGSTPNLVETESGWECNKCPEQTGRGAVLVDGTYANDWRT